MDVRVHVSIPEGFDCLYHQDQKLLQVEDTSLQIQLQDGFMTSEEIVLSV